ncbi:hypothetical protein SLS53_002429 [Cytospora paraplurivora]|uniref:Trafficking protein particle complex subunit 2-like protein n=1 Tax=Cytospora paraplurivora TaxID=2898453 RepID=A0AAN9UHB8_9PEZI
MATAIPSIACLGVIGRNNNPLHISIFPSHDPATNTLKPIRTPLQFSLLLSSTLDVFDLRAKHSAVTGGNGSSGAAGTINNGPMSGEYGLLHAVDERLAAYGYETNTGVKFVVVVDMRGRRIDSAALSYLSSHASSEGGGGGGGGAGGGVSDGVLAARHRESVSGVGKEATAAAAAAAAAAVLGGRRSRVGAAAVVGLREGDMKVVFRAMQTAYVRLLQDPFYEPDEHAPLAGCGGKRITSRRFEGDMRRIGEGWTVGVTSL